MNSIKIANETIDTKNHEVLQNDKVKLTSMGGVAVKADTSPSPTMDLDDRDGWLWQKASSDESKFNYYMYGASGSSHPWTLADLKSGHMTCSIDKWDNTASCPFVVVYTTMIGDGTDAGSWYHSKRAYALNSSNHKIVVGEHLNLYCIYKPNFKNDNRSIPLESITNTGDCLDTEVISAISIHSDSSSLMGTKILISEMGFNLGNEIKRSIKLVT